MAGLDADDVRRDRADSSAVVARLQQLARKVASEDDLYRDILDAAMEFVGSDAGSIQVADSERGGLRLVAWRGFDPKSAAFWEFVGAGSDATCGTAHERGERVIVEDVEAVPAFAGGDDLREWRRSGIRAVQSTPLVTRDGRVIGMLSTHWRVPHQPLEDELRLVDLLARQAADLLERGLDRDCREEREREFIANASHELRTPVAAMIGAVAALEAGAKDEPAERDRFFAHLKDEGARLARLMDSLLLLARSPEDVPRAPFRVKPLLEEIALGLTVRGIAVEVEAPDELVVVTNRGLVERVLANLAANAADHSGQGSVMLSATATESSVLIDVLDSGVGIDPRTAERAFDCFFRGGRGPPARFGLGLSVARQGAAALGAKVTLARHPGGGTVAQVVLPADSSRAHDLRLS